jgi:hypothetical protein
MVLFPKRLYRAFIRGRHSSNLYHDGFPKTELSSKTVGWLRDRLEGPGAAAEARPTDRIAFARWCLVAFTYHATWLVVGVAIFWWLLDHIRR